MDEQEMLNKIAKIIEEFENPTGHDNRKCIGAEIMVDTNRTYVYDGEKFVKCWDCGNEPWKDGCGK